MLKKCEEIQENIFTQGNKVKSLSAQIFWNEGGPNTEEVGGGIKYAIRVIFHAGPRGIN